MVLHDNRNQSNIIEHSPLSTVQHEYNCLLLADQPDLTIQKIMPALSNGLLQRLLLSPLKNDDVL